MKFVKLAGSIGVVLVSVYTLGAPGMARAQEASPPSNAEGICHAVVTQTDSRGGSNGKGPNPTLLALALTQLEPELESIEADLTTAERAAGQFPGALEALGALALQAQELARTNPDSEQLDLMVQVLREHHSEITGRAIELRDDVRDLGTRISELSAACGGLIDLSLLEARLSALRAAVNGILANLASLGALIDQIAQDAA